MDAFDWIQRGDQHWQNADLEGAAAAYQQALALDPDNADIHNDLGIIYNELKEFDQAEAHFQTALQLDPSLVQAHFNLGLLYKDQGRNQAAQTELERYLERVQHSQATQEVYKLLNELSGQDYVKCFKCGNIATLGQYYTTNKKHKVCPRCYPALQGRRTLIGLVYLVMFWFMLDALALLYGSEFEIFYYHGVNLALFVALSFLMIIPHELAHAGIARLLRGWVFEIRVGLGPVVWQTWSNGVLFSLARYPLAGYNILAFASRQFVRVRLFLAVAAGPVFSALVVASLVPGYKFSNLHDTWAWRESLVNANVFILFLNLLPRKINFTGVPSLNDGGQLWRLITDRRAGDAIHLFFFLLKGAYAIKAHAYADALQVSRAGMALYPHSTLLKNNRAVALLETEQHSEALELFQELLVSLQKETSHGSEITDDNRAFTQAMLMNNIACATILTDPEPDALQQAHDYAQQAFRMLPWFAPIQGTWGAVLVEMGRAQEGVEHLLQTYAHSESDKSRATNLAYTALGYQQLGDVDKAAESMEKALALDKSSYVVQKVKAALQGVN